MKKHLVAVAVLLFLADPLHAESTPERGWYMGGAYGLTFFEDDSAFDEPGVSFDDRDSSYQIFGGYRFIRYFAIEGRFTDLGKYRYEKDAESLSYEFASWAVHALGIYPLGASGFDIYGQLGLGAVFKETKTSSPEFDDDEGAGLFGAGLGLRYTPPRFQSITFTVAYDWYTFDAELENSDETLEQGFRTAKFALQYNF